MTSGLNATIVYTRAEDGSVSIEIDPDAAITVYPATGGTQTLLFDEDDRYLVAVTQNGPELQLTRGGVNTGAALPVAPQGRTGSPAKVMELRDDGNVLFGLDRQGTSRLLLVGEHSFLMTP